MRSCQPIHSRALQTEEDYIFDLEIEEYERNHLTDEDEGLFEDNF
jgi:hypothetical protein